MEVLLFLVAVIFAPMLLSRLLAAARSKGVVSTLDRFLGMHPSPPSTFDLGALDVRFKDTRIGDPESGIPAKAIEARGPLPVQRRTRLGTVTSVFDTTENESKPVFSSVEALQEPGSIVYQASAELGAVSPNQGFGAWARVGIVVPSVIQPPVGGRREIAAVLRFIDMDRAPDIEHGRADEQHAGLLWQKVLVFEHLFEEKGYEEVAEHRDEARAVALKIGMAVAWSDGSLDYAEGTMLREWIVKVIAPYAGPRRNALKSLYNKTLVDAFAAAPAGELVLSDLTARLNEIGERATKYEAIELCYDVMAADGVADAGELTVLRQVAEALDLDYDEIEKLHDQKLVGLEPELTSQASTEELFGIDPSWPVDRIKRHLRQEFQKWSNRLNALPQGEERWNAQRMLELIAEAREKYD